MGCSCGSVVCRGQCGSTEQVCTAVGLSSTCTSPGLNEIGGGAACCDNAIPSAPTPAYNCASSCVEDHTNVVNNIYVSPVIKVSTAWNIPECGATAVLTVPDLIGVLAGLNIWHPTYGYFEIVSFDIMQSTITVKNNCLDDNEDPGTAVPSCTQFAVTPPPCCEDNGGGGLPSIFPYVAIDFTAPAVSSCIDITVTTINGLIVGKNIQIGSGTYLLNGISGTTIINICNNGAGITPLTPVIAKDASGDYQYPVILLDASACTNPPVIQGALMVCKDGVQQPLSGSLLGSVPVLVDAETGEVVLKPLDIPPRTCTYLTDCCLSLIPGQESYVLIVADTSEFEVGDILQIGDRDDRFTVTAINDETHMTVNADPIPSAFEQIEEGTAVCEVTCCEKIQDQILPCLKQITVGAVPLQFFTIDDIVLTGGDEGVGGVYEVVVSVDLLGEDLVLPETCGEDADYYLKAVVSFAAIPAMTPGDADGMRSLHEVEFVWSDLAAPRTFGKNAWTYDTKSDPIWSNGGSPDYPPSDDFAVWNQLVSTFDIGGAWPMGYKAAEVTARAFSIAPGTPVNLQFHYKVMVSNVYGVGTFDQIRFMVSGTWELLKTN